MNHPGAVLVDPEVCSHLGRTEEEIRKMSLRDFSDLCFAKGLIPRVGPIERAEVGAGGLLIEMCHTPATEPKP